MKNKPLLITALMAFWAMPTFAMDAPDAHGADAAHVEAADVPAEDQEGVDMEAEGEEMPADAAEGEEASADDN